jgi:hypothetical protein
MKLSVNVVIQVLGTIVQVVNLVSGVVPKDFEWVVAGVVGVIQAVTGILAHFANPDGTPAAAPYVAPK